MFALGDAAVVCGACVRVPCDWCWVRVAHGRVWLCGSHASGLGSFRFASPQTSVAVDKHDVLEVHILYMCV